jgi:hypothetical protein
MRQPRKFEVYCFSLNKQVTLETKDWYTETGVNVDGIHYRAVWPCGKEHFGTSVPTKRAA